MHWAPLFSPDTSIQWDAVDVHYSSQKYLSDQLLTGHLPQWTPYIFSGFPFLADPQVGAWYPLNWPFFLFGIAPTSIEVEGFVHVLIACFGAYALSCFLFKDRWAATLAGLLYGGSGFFAAHSSHTGMVQTAAWLPWLILGWQASLRPGKFSLAALTGLGAGCMILAGHFQTSLYAFAGLGLAALALTRRNQLARACASLVVLAAIAISISAIQTLPGLELTRESIRATADFSNATEGTLSAKALLTLLLPDALGALGTYHGPGDVTQFYFYMGLLAVPLALCGLFWGTRRDPAAGNPAAMLGIVLLVVPLWYAIGPLGGLYRLIAVLPGFRSVRAPVHIWFVAALGIALLAAAGALEISKRFQKAGSRLMLVLIAVVAIDLFYWNSAANPLAYARSSFDDLYGNAEQKVAVNLAAKQPPLTRFHAPRPLSSFGPLNHPLDIKLESTYGYNPLELKSYANFIESANTNRLLLNSLNASRVLVIDPPDVIENPGVLPRAYFPPQVVTLSGPNEIQSRLRSMDPAKTALVEGQKQLRQDGSAQARIVNSTGESLQLNYKAARDSLLRISIPYFPGWHATVDGRPFAVLRVDHALLGVVVPAGAHQLLLEFHSEWLKTGAVTSFLGLLATASIVAWGRRQPPRAVFVP